MALTLRPLRSSDESSFFEGMIPWRNDLSWYTFSWKPGMPYSEMLEILRKEERGIGLAPGRVPHTMLYAFLEGKIIGRVSVRHALNENLKRRGGHIGYAVTEPYRRQGHATEMVRQALDYCRELGLSEVMVTCADDNVPSWKTIEKFNFRLEDKVWDDEDQEVIRRYWISI